MVAIILIQKGSYSSAAYLSIQNSFAPVTNLLHWLYLPKKKSKHVRFFDSLGLCSTMLDLNRYEREFPFDKLVIKFSIQMSLFWE